MQREINCDCNCHRLHRLALLWLKCCCQETIKARDQTVRQYEQETDSLMFRNRQLSTRVSVLQEELDRSDVKHAKHKQDKVCLLLSRITPLSTVYCSYVHTPMFFIVAVCNICFSCAIKFLLSPALLDFSTICCIIDCYLWFVIHVVWYLYVLHLFSYLSISFFFFCAVIPVCHVMKSLCTLWLCFIITI